MLAYLLNTETEDETFQHNIGYGFHYSVNDDFYIQLPNGRFIEAPSTAFTFKDELSVHEKINARSHCAGLSFLVYAPYKYSRLLSERNRSQPNHSI